MQELHSRLYFFSSRTYIYRIYLFHNTLIEGNQTGLGPEIWAAKTSDQHEQYTDSRNADSSKP
jgi:hypothetical protein